MGALATIGWRQSRTRAGVGQAGAWLVWRVVPGWRTAGGDRDVAHVLALGRAVPVQLAGHGVDDIARVDLLFLEAAVRRFDDHAALAIEDVEHLVTGVLVPISMRALVEVDDVDVEVAQA